MIKHEGKGNFGVRVELKDDPSDVTIYWSTHKLSQDDNFKAFRSSNKYYVTIENK